MIIFAEISVNNNCAFVSLKRLARQNEKIMNAHRTVAETEDIANEITEELGRNREKIESSHGKVY